jgi:hypothetical protein
LFISFFEGDNPRKEERPLAEPFYELTYETIQATAVQIEEPY